MSASWRAVHEARSPGMRTVKSVMLHAGEMAEKAARVLVGEGAHDQNQWSGMACLQAPAHRLGDDRTASLVVAAVEPEFVASRQQRPQLAGADRLQARRPVDRRASPLAMSASVTGRRKWRTAAMAVPALSNWYGPISAGSGRSIRPASS